MKPNNEKKPGLFTTPKILPQLQNLGVMAAIKIHHPLAPAARQGLLDDLFRARNPSTCPHGRPALFRLSLEELERAFRRR